jgi:P-type conjugative transfer ATPase TrbB
VSVELQEELTSRRRDALKHSFGPLVMKALQDPDVIEIMLNDDSRLWVEKLGEMSCVGTIDKDNAMAILVQVSSALNGELSKEDPFVEGELVLMNGERFEGVAPPVTARSIFAIRKKATRIFTLNDYVRAGVITFRQAEKLRKAVLEQKNILVIGGTGSGKTTFCNALLAAVAELMPHIRMLILEDTQELQCQLENRVFMRTSPWTTMGQMSKAVNRLRPDSVSVGEVREGAPALALLKLWNTGHPGGLATVHADSALKGLTRMDQLIQEVSSFPQRALIGEAVNVAVYLEKRAGKRRVKEIVRVKGYNELTKTFEIEDITNDIIH